MDMQVETSNDEPIDNASSEQDLQDKNVVSKGKKRSLKHGPPAKRKKKFQLFQQPKNALMQLNELKPGLQYEFQSQQGPAHEPVFVVCVNVNEQKFIGKGCSKQLAKHAAAEAALSSFVQFRNMPEAMCVMSKQILSANFTDDNVENEVSIFNKFEHQANGNGLQSSLAMQSKFNNKIRKIETEADKKNPVMLLNELRPGLVYTVLKENTSIPSQRFVIGLNFDGEQFKGVGQNKRAAKAAAARCVLSKRYNVYFNPSPFDSSHEMTVDPDIFTFPQATADEIAKRISDIFNDVMVDNPKYAKWKVLAGIALTKDEEMNDIQIVGIGTGTKNLNGVHMDLNGTVLNDCHAEIISRRCLKDFLYTQLELHIEGEGDQSIFEKKESHLKFTLKSHHKFHLFISTSPCGDARIFSVHDETDNPNHKAKGLLRTKIESGEGTIPVKDEQCIQTWDKIVQGQQRYLTMSCSDKIASWNILGLQGSLLNHFIEPIYLDSIILGRLFHPNHIYRAVYGRFETAIGELQSSFHLNKPKMCSTTSLETRQLAKPPNFSINWTVGLGRPEIIFIKTGKTQSGHVSRLSKKSFFLRFANIYNAFSSKTSEFPTPHLYASEKARATNYMQTKEQMKRAFVLAGLGNWVEKPSQQDEFELMF